MNEKRKFGAFKKGKHKLFVCFLLYVLEKKDGLKIIWFSKKKVIKIPTCRSLTLKNKLKMGLAKKN